MFIYWLCIQINLVILCPCPTLSKQSWMNIPSLQFFTRQFVFPDFFSKIATYVTSNLIELFRFNNVASLHNNFNFKVLFFINWKTTVQLFQPKCIKSAQEKSQRYSNEFSILYCIDADAIYIKTSRFFAHFCKWWLSSRLRRAPVGNF